MTDQIILTSQKFQEEEVLGNALFSTTKREIAERNFSFQINDNFECLLKSRPFDILVCKGLGQVRVIFRKNGENLLNTHLCSFSDIRAFLNEVQSEMTIHCNEIFG